MRNHGDHTTRRLTNDELKAAEAAFQGLAFDEAWSKAARTVYEGIVIVKMTRARHEFLALEYCRPGRAHASVLLDECAFRSREAMANQA
jgi:hypothetical protein